MKSDQESGCVLGEARPTWNFVVFLSFVINIKRYKMSRVVGGLGRPSHNGNYQTMTTEWKDAW